MQDNNFDKIISDAILTNKKNLSQNIKPIINQISKVIKDNKEIIKQANEIDKKNNNGFLMDFNVIDNILENLSKEDILYGKVVLQQKDDDKKIIYGKEILDYGNIVVINDGNPYVTIEMALRNIMAGNTTIFSNKGYMYGTNQLLIQMIQAVLEQFNISKSLIQLAITEDFTEILSNYANIDLVVCIGDHDLQNQILSKSKNKTIISGYENFDLYIDDITHADFINKIMNLGLNIQMYVNDNIKSNYPDAIKVNDIDEAIAQINYIGNRYAASIFTTSEANASEFIKKVKSKIVTVNTSPTIERMIDINQADLVNEKTIIYPMSYKFDKTTQKIYIKEKETE